MQTVPSLALFGFLIPLNIYLFHVKIVGGIGARTAIVALVLYALLPIIRNTFTGISNVDPAIRDAGRGMGMTDRQLLFQVELPLALGVIIAGVRVATVICVGTATIAAAIDAGGLGPLYFSRPARQRQCSDPGRRGAGGVDRARRGSGCSAISSARFSSATTSAQSRKNFSGLAHRRRYCGIIGGVYSFAGKSAGRDRGGLERFYRAGDSRRDSRANDRRQNRPPGRAPLRFGRQSGARSAGRRGDRSFTSNTPARRCWRS